MDAFVVAAPPAAEANVAIIDEAEAAKKELEGLMFKTMTADHLKSITPVIFCSWGTDKKQDLEETSKCPLALVALLEFMQLQCPHLCADKGNGGQKLGGGEDRVKWCKNHFPRGVSWLHHAKSRQATK